jgi:biopolymer transport protein ExbD
MSLHDDNGGDEIIASINMTPLVDISLTILVIFMLVSTFIAKEAIEVELPHAATGAEIDKKTVSILISKEGDYYIGAAQMADFSALRDRMAAEKGSDPSLQVIISADRQVQHGTVVEVIDMLRRLELYNFAINVEYKAPPAGR